MIDPRRLKPAEMCRLLNSTPLGEVINAYQLRLHRERAGHRIGDSKHVDLLRYTAWLVHERHGSKPEAKKRHVHVDLAEAALGAAAIAAHSKPRKGHGQKLSSRQEAVIAALLTEPTYALAAVKAGINECTIYRWMHLPSFRRAFLRARRELVDLALGRMQTATAQAVETLLAVARQGPRDADRVRASIAILDQACKGVSETNAFFADPDATPGESMTSADVVAALTARLRQIDNAELPTTDKAKLTATLADALLRAISVDVLDQRLEAMQTVLMGRKTKPKRK